MIDIEKIQPLRIHLGCGNRAIPGFVNVDIRPLPHVDLIASAENLSEFRANSADLIYCSHLLEHMERGAEVKALAEWHRVLKPGAILRLAVPDFEKIVVRYQAEKNLDELIGLLYGKQDHEFNVHHQAFDFPRLERLLLGVGFSSVSRYDWRVTIHKDIDDYSQAYLPHMDKERGLLMSLNVEAIK